MSELKKQYRDFRMITDNPEFKVYPTEEAVPDVIPDDAYIYPSEEWYGYAKNHECRTLYLRGYMAYKASDERIKKVASWIYNKTEKLN